MKINGYVLREAIKRWTSQRNMANTLFTESILYFKGDEKPNLEKLMQQFLQADKNLCELQSIQQQYNQKVICQVQSEKIPLALCVKLVGGAGRSERLWREAAGNVKRSRYSSYDEPVRQRNKETEYAEKSLDSISCSKQAEKAAKYASDLRNAIARGCIVDVDSTELSLTEERAKELLD